MVQLIGNLQGIGLARLLRFLTELRVSGRLALTVDSGSCGTVYLEGGRIVGATLDSDYEAGLVALEALALMSSHTSFLVADPAGDIRGNLDVDTPALLEHLDHVSDESTDLMRTIGSLQCVPRVAHAEENSQDPVAISRGALRLLLELRGERTVLALGHLYGLRSTLEHLQELIELRLVSVGDAHASQWTNQPASELTQLFHTRRQDHEFHSTSTSTRTDRASHPGK